MASEPAPTRKTILVDDRFLRIFERRAEQEKTILTFMLGGIAGCVYGVAVTFLTLHH